MIKIVSDSSADKEAVREEDYEYVYAPLSINVEDKVYVDNKDLNVEELVEHLKRYNGKTSTACPSVGDWLDCYEGGDEILVFTMTSAISGTFNSASIAAENYKAGHKDCKIYVFDTLTTGAEQRLIVEEAVKLAKQNLSFEQIVEKMNEFIKRCRMFFSLQSLHNFAANGRVSKVVAKIAGVLGIRILGTVGESGTLQPLAKCINNKLVVNNLLKEISKCGFKGGEVQIAHVGNLAFAEVVKKAIEDNFENANVNIYPTRGLCSYYAENGGVLVGLAGEHAYKKQA